MLDDPAINKIWLDQEEILANFPSDQMIASSLLAPLYIDAAPTPASS